MHGLPKHDVSSTDEDSHAEDSPYESSSSEVDPKVIYLPHFFRIIKYFKNGHEKLIIVNKIKDLNCCNLQEVEQIEKQIEKKENELKKITTGMGKVFLTELEKERERQKLQLHKMIDPRSAARTPAANRLPHFKLR